MAIAQTFVCMVILLAAVIPYTHSVSFYFPSFPPNVKGIYLQGNASISNRVIKLTSNEIGVDLTNNAGRALYSHAIQIWDSETAWVADFTTQFTFAIESVADRKDFGDGITFFLAPDSTEIPPNSAGGYLALFNSTNSGSDENHIVGVEFDTYVNSEWDPAYRHVGIDVNKIRSEISTGWKNTVFTNGGKGTVDVSVNYYSTDKLLVVHWTDIESTLSLSYNIDISKILPQWVRIGFSGTTGEQVQVNQVLSWSFTSTEFYENKVIRLNDM